MAKNLDKYKGCLIGGAAGDALGFAVEFFNERKIFSKYGENGITEYDLKNGIAEISDDTQMTLFTATGLLVGTTRGNMRGIMGTYPSYINFSYRDWYRTQTEQYPLKDKHHYSWLVNLPQMFSSRAPGNTCLSAIKSNTFGTIEEPINRSKGCGGVMRVAPIGLYFGDKPISIDEVDKIGAEAAALTHGHSLGYIPSAASMLAFFIFNTRRCLTAVFCKNTVEASNALKSAFKCYFRHRFICFGQQQMGFFASVMIYQRIEACAEGIMEEP